jgi:peptide/nickel transport system ATP-binding protein
MAMLEVRDLRVQFRTDDGLVKAVDGLSFDLERGRTLGIVGESGSGKSVTSLAIMGLHRGSGTDITGQIRLDGEDLVSATPERVRQLRGLKMAMIFQDPLTALHPYYTVGAQISEAYRVHNHVSKQVARKRAIDLLGRVGIPQPTVRVDDFPHQFSGGMRQRAMIAMALSCDPELLIADEPTTALDVTVQAQILDLIVDLQSEFGSAVIIITHDLGVVAEVADDVLVMYAGREAEKGSADDVFRQPGHPYAWGLLGSMPRLDAARVDRLRPIRGTPPSLINVPSGCPFHPRCSYPSRVGGDRCKTDIPVPREIGPGHQVACHLTLSSQREIWAELAKAAAPAEAPPAETAGTAETAETAETAPAETAARTAAQSATPGEPGQDVTEVEAP